MCRANGFSVNIYNQTFMLLGLTEAGLPEVSGKSDKLTVEGNESKMERDSNLNALQDEGN